MRQLTLVALLLATGMMAQNVDAQGTYCMPNADSAEAWRQFISDVATGTDSASQAQRSRYGIPSTTDSKVAVITKESTCQTAGEAFSAAADSTPVGGRRVFVVKAKDVYAVWDPTDSFGEWSRAMFFTSQWNLLSKMIR